MKHTKLWEKQKEAVKEGHRHGSSTPLFSLRKIRVCKKVVTMDRSSWTECTHLLLNGA